MSLRRLEAAREALAENLGLALDRPAYPHVPEAVEPGCVIVQAGDPYLVGGETFGGDYSLTLDLFLVVDLLGNEQATDDADDLLEDLLEALEGTEYGVDRVGRPGPVQTAEWLAHAITVTVSRYINL